LMIGASDRRLRRGEAKRRDSTEDNTKRQKTERNGFIDLGKRRNGWH
jgi:hypothetical protein